MQLKKNVFEREKVKGPNVNATCPVLIGSFTLLIKSSDGCEENSEKKKKKKYLQNRKRTFHLNEAERE